MDWQGLYGENARATLWNEIPDISTNDTLTLEITVAENYEPDENGIRFIGVTAFFKTDRRSTGTEKTAFQIDKTRRRNRNPLQENL